MIDASILYLCLSLWYKTLQKACSFRQVSKIRFDSKQPESEFKEFELRLDAVQRFEPVLNWNRFLAV